jgi:hypothetical protein
MKKLLIIIFLIPFLSLQSQTCPTIIAYDNIETYTWNGLWFGTIVTEGYFTDASVSPTTSAIMYGVGGGSSAIEQDWYVLPNITGLNPSYTYQFKMRLGSYTFSNSTATTRGVDAADLVEVQISTNGEVSYTSEIRVTGNSNATWNYNAAGVINKTATGTLTTYSPTAGGNRTATGDGYSDITLTMTGISQLAVDILCRVNAGGEEWWLDNIQLIEIAPCAPLPVTLSQFKAVKKSTHNEITWRTETELNNDYFILERSVDGVLWSEIAKVDGNGNSLIPINYKWEDKEYKDNSLNYYILKQVDFNGESSYYEIKYVDNTYDDQPYLIKTIDFTGRTVSETQAGIVIKIYSDGSFQKVVNLK